MANITTVGGRAKLATDSDTIHWAKRAKGRFIGYRKTSANGGVWWARLRDDEGKQHYRKLGDFAGQPPNAWFTAAARAADAWFLEIDSGVVPSAAATVGLACERHIKALQADAGDAKANAEEARFRRLVYGDPIAKIELGKLKKAALEDWRRRVAAMPARVWRRKAAKVSARNRPGASADESRARAPATVNRDMAPLRAALNRALDDGLVASDLAWRVALKPIKNADRRRGIYLDRDDRARLLGVAAEEIRPFLHALAVLPLRPGALAALTVSDFDGRTRTLRVGRDKTGGERRIVLPGATAALLVIQSKGKLPGAPLFTDAAGRAWSKDSWKKPIKAAVQDAKLPPATSAYTLRHSVITDLVAGGLDLLTVAQISGTSVAMIEAHYGHLRRDAATAALAALAV